MQGFDWNTTEYKVDGTDADDADENDGGNGEPDIVRPQIDERTYLILAQRYKELFDDDSCAGEPDDDGRCDPEAPYELEGYLTEIDTGLIDTDYMNANFVKWLKALKEDSPSWRRCPHSCTDPSLRFRGTNNDLLSCSCMMWSVAMWKSRKA